jgi:AcrR family transcriptional regulator
MRQRSVYCLRVTVLEGPDAGERSGVEERATDALLVCIARFGLTKTTLDDVARVAGCSRATLYRYFGDKATLVRRTVDVELARTTGRSVAAADDASTLPEAVVALVSCAARDLVAHGALQFLLAHEPESILGQLAFGPGDRVLVRVGDAFAPAFTRWLSAEDARRAGEWLARILRSYVLMPKPSIDLTDVGDARDFLEELVIPGIAHTHSQKDSHPQ